MKTMRLYFHSDDENSQNLGKALRLPPTIEQRIEFFNIRNMSHEALPEEVDGVPLLVDEESKTLHKGVEMIGTFMRDKSASALTSISLKSRSQKRRSFREQSFVETYIDYPLPPQDYSKQVRVTNDANNTGAPSQQTITKDEIKRRGQTLFNQSVG